MMTNEQLYLIIGVPILFNLLGFYITNMRISDIIHRLDIIDKDLREWAKIIMTHNTDIGRMKDKLDLK